MYVMLIDVLAKFGSLLNDDLARFTGCPRMECIGQTVKSMKPALLPVVAEHIVELENIEPIFEMVKHLKQTFAEMIEDSDMISNGTTRAKAIRKLDRIKVDIACPRELMNATLLDAIYKGYEMQEDSICDNIRRSRLVDETLSRRFGKSSWTKILEDKTDPTSFNAKYFPTLNHVYVFPSLVNEYFLIDETSYIKYGVLGSVIGHEFGHAFDPRSRERDEQYKKSLWDKESDKSYEQRSAMIRRQYGGCEKSLPDDMADNMGFLVAYRAYSDWLDGSSKCEEKLPGFAWSTPKQLFWASLANLWCQPESELGCTKHSPNILRVNEPLKNLREFSKSFGCKSDRPMNPKQKNRIW